MSQLNRWYVAPGRGMLQVSWIEQGKITVLVCVRFVMV